MGVIVSMRGVQDGRVYVVGWIVEQVSWLIVQRSYPIHHGIQVLRVVYKSLSDLHGFNIFCAHTCKGLLKIPIQFSGYGVGEQDTPQALSVIKALMTAPSLTSTDSPG